MKTKNIKFGLSLASIILLLAYATSCFVFINGKTVSGNITLDPLEDRVFSFKMHEDDVLYISGEVTSGSISILIFESAAYPDGSYYEEYWYDLTSSFTREFDAGWTDTFYIVFENPSYDNSATVTFTLEHDTAFNTNLIINLSISGTFLVAIAVVNFIGKNQNSFGQ